MLCCVSFCEPIFFACILPLEEWRPWSSVFLSLLSGGISLAVVLVFVSARNVFATLFLCVSCVLPLPSHEAQCGYVRSCGAPPSHEFCLGRVFVFMFVDLCLPNFY